jgi:hypothetical protein
MRHLDNRSDSNWCILVADDHALHAPGAHRNLRCIPEAAREAEFRQFLHTRAKNRADEELLGAKMVGRWRSGAPLVLSPEGDDPALGEDSRRNDAFLYAKEDARGFKCPFGAHARRAYPRDSAIVGIARNHRMIRRGTSYGPPLPEGLLIDDGVDRGLLFICIVGDRARQFEFVQTQWINDGAFMGSPDEVDPLVGPNDGTRRLTIPRGRSAAVSRGCRISSSIAAANIVSCLVCVPCVGSLTSIPDRRNIWRS